MHVSEWVTNDTEVILSEETMSVISDHTKKKSHVEIHVFLEKQRGMTGNEAMALTSICIYATQSNVHVTKVSVFFYHIEANEI